MMWYARRRLGFSLARVQPYVKTYGEEPATYY